MIAPALLERPAAAPVDAKPAAFWTGQRLLALVGVLVYGLGMLCAMLWSAVSGRDWTVFFLVLTQCLVAVGCGAGAMACALLVPDPYIGEHGKPPAKLPDFS